MNARQAFACLVLFVALCMCVLVYKSPGTAASLAAYALYVRSPTKTILYWNKFFGDESFTLGEGDIARSCPRYKNCLATHSRFIQSIDSFDAILFHGINAEIDPEDLPSRRSPEQRYIFMAMESPQNRFASSAFDGYFNWTATYRLNSDLAWTYFDLVDGGNRSVMTALREDGVPRWRTSGGKRSAEEERRLDQLIAGKRELAVWYRSNCETQSAREKYVGELERFARVGKFGRCSNEIGCPRDLDCFRIDVEPKYFFYLSFENSLCDDYVTEKFYNALSHYVVPVVYGGADYDRLAPPKSYINALDFDTPEDLANYLVKLSKNATEYKKYFDWKEHYRVADSVQRIICDLCELLNTNVEKKTYTISQWYSSNSCPLQHKLRKQLMKGGPPFATRKTLLE